MSYNRVTFGKKLRESRIAHGMTKDECAEAIGCNAGTIYRWENGQTFPSEGIAKKIAQFMGFDHESYRDDFEDVRDRSHAFCRDENPCCMKRRGMCVALGDTFFRDGKCRFRKERPNGPNMYDKERKENAK